MGMTKMGRGGGPYSDGADGAAAPVHNMANTPVEIIEANQPLRVNRYGFVSDTGGSGKYRGGLGMVREYELLNDEAILQIRSDRNKFLPWGTQGGGPGSRSYNILNPDSNMEILPSKFLRTLNKGDVYRCIQSGAGGYGDSLERDVDSVHNDIIQQKITLNHAKMEYGVVVDANTLEIDLKATKILRNKLMKDRVNYSRFPKVIPSSDIYSANELPVLD